MDDRLKESISALLDNEADELELRRVLSRADDRELKDQWRRYHTLSDLMTDDTRSIMAFDVSQSVMAQIDREQVQDRDPILHCSALNTMDRGADKLSGMTFYQGRSVPLWSAVAASFAMASLALLWSPVEMSSPVAPHDVRQPVVHQVEALSDEQNEVVSQYMLRHAEYAAFGFRQGVLPLARIASASVSES